MKFASIFSSTFFMFNVFQLNSARYLLVEVEGTGEPIEAPPKDWTPWRPLNLHPVEAGKTKLSLDFMISKCINAINICFLVQTEKCEYF